MPYPTHQATDEERQAATAWLQRRYDSFVASGHKRIELDLAVTGQARSRGRVQWRKGRPSTVPLDRILAGHVPMPNVLTRFADPFDVPKLALLAIFGYRREVLKAASKLIYAGKLWINQIGARIDPIGGMSAVPSRYERLIWTTETTVLEQGNAGTVTLRLPWYTSVGIAVIVLSLPTRGEVRTPDWDRADRIGLMGLSETMIDQTQTMLDRAHIRNPLPGVLRVADMILQRKDLTLETRIVAAAEIARDYCRSVSLLPTLDVEKVLYGTESASRPTFSNFLASQAGNK